MEKFSYLRSINGDYIEGLFHQYLENPESVDPTWRYFFEGLELSETFATSKSSAHSKGANGHALKPGENISLGSVDLNAEAKVAELINTYRERGKLLARVNPLDSTQPHRSEFELTNFGLTEKDMGRTFTAGKLLGMGPATLNQIIEHLRLTYCSSIAVEYTHIQDPGAREWLQKKMESSQNRESLDPQAKLFILKRLTDSEVFERFLHTRYVGKKRFSIEGAEALICALDRSIETAATLGANNIVMGMAHRGRLNVLLNTYGKPAEYILTEFEENYEIDNKDAGSGDVKYHMGFSADIETRLQQKMHLSLAHNPSHLEYVNPVVEGMTRAKQRDLHDFDRIQVIPILIHGDAAFAGQGVVYETLNFAQLEGYRTGGTIHIVIDNQVGFTANPQETRSTPYSTDVAKMLETPIFHVNGDDPEAVWYVSHLATEYRQRFKTDVFIDLISYRRHGHNEGDEPLFTQPLLYKTIKDHPTVRTIYAQKLIQSGILTAENDKQLVDKTMNALLDAQQKTRANKPKPLRSAYKGKWAEFKSADKVDVFKRFETTFDQNQLKDLGIKLYTTPETVHPHPKLVKLIEQRKKGVESGEGIDWGNAELLAYATLLHEGHTVRLSGQDCGRGTFSHRHSVLHDYETGKPYIPLNHLSDSQSEFIVKNSHLSEAGVLGFEYGWSLADPEALVIWEAQFGDFANSGQVIIDQFISSSESKWNRASGIILFLPHGHEGQGPEHSSARPERFLQLCGQNNMSICNLTNPAQLFHMLRRQMKRDFRKPLVLFTPKSLLRHPKNICTLEDLAKGSFEEVLVDPSFAGNQDTENVQRILLCTGKVFYDLLEEREKRNLQSQVAIIRLEQLYPWPAEHLSNLIHQFPPSAELYWVQEEPRNMGAWMYIFGQWCGGYAMFQEWVGGRTIGYIGRDINAAPAVGSLKQHTEEQKELITKAFSFS